MRKYFKGVNSDCYYNKIETKGLSEDFLIDAGTVTQDQKIPSPLNPLLPF